MDDQRIVLGPSFGFKDLFHRILIERIGAQPIDRFRWKGDDATLLNDFRSLLYALHIYSVFEIHFNCFHFYSKNGDSKTVPPSSILSITQRFQFFRLVKSDQ